MADELRVGIGRLRAVVGPEGDVKITVRAQKLGGEPPEWIQIFPDGDYVCSDGTYLCDAESRRLVIAHFKDRGNDLVIDYEHQTLLGSEAPAAGWITELDDRGKDGLWAKVTWTDRAAEYLRSGEYRFDSPVYDVDKSNRVVALHNVALTNWPGSNERTPLTEQIAASVRALRTRSQKAEGPMDKETARCMIRWGSEIPATATNKDVRTYMTKLLEQIPNDDNLFILDSDAGAGTLAQGLGITYGEAGTPNAGATIVAQKLLLDELDLPATATLAQAHARVGDLKTGAAEVEALRAENKTLKQKLATSEAKTGEEKIALLIQSNRSRIPPAKEAWVRAVAQKHGIDHATEVVRNMPEVLPGSGAAEAEPIVEETPATQADSGRRVNQKAAARKARVEKVMRDNPKLTYEEASDELYRREGNQA